MDPGKIDSLCGPDLGQKSSSQDLTSRQKYEKESLQMAIKKQQNSQQQQQQSRQQQQGITQTQSSTPATLTPAQLAKLTEKSGEGGGERIAAEEEDEPDYEGKGYGSGPGWEGVPRHHHPTKLSDVLEKDERSRTSASQSGGGEKLIDFSPDRRATRLFVPKQPAPFKFRSSQTTAARPDAPAPDSDNLYGSYVDPTKKMDAGHSQVEDSCIKRRQSIEAKQPDH